MVSDFQDYCCSNLENKNTLAIRTRNTLQNEPLKYVDQICVWQLLLKSFKNIFKGVKFAN